MQLDLNAFDSDHFDLRIGKLVASECDGLPELRTALSRARVEGYDVLFVRLHEHAALRLVLEAEGYRALDELVTSTRGSSPHHRLSVPIAVVQIEQHTQIDDPAVVAEVSEIAAQNLDRSHLHSDPRLPAERTRNLFASWARNDVTGRAARVLIARVDGAIAGFLTAVQRDSVAVIDLVAARQTMRGRGVGSALVAEFIAWHARLGFTASVGTQATNPALRLYERAGFEPSSRDFTYHLWLR